MSTPADNAEQKWERGWDGHALEQLRRLAQLTLPDKIAWLEQAQRVARHLAAQPVHDSADRATGKQTKAPRHRHPVIQQIDAALDTLDPEFISFAAQRSYEFSKSVDGDFNPPKRRLDRLPQRQGFLQVISLQVVGRDPKANAPPQLGPDMPCTLTLFASALVEDRWKCVRQEIFSALPFSRLPSELSYHLQAAHRKLDEWTYEKVVTDGVEE
jgi:hypothetical protein